MRWWASGSTRAIWPTSASRRAKSSTKECFPKAVIVASNDLDEQIITSIKQQGGKIGIWGVGTKLVTAYDQPAMGGVYKLGAIREETGDWLYRLKLSEQPLKVSTPGLQQVRRFRLGQECIGDMIYNLKARR